VQSTQNVYIVQRSFSQAPAVGPGGARLGLYIGPRLEASALDGKTLSKKGFKSY